MVRIENTVASWPDWVRWAVALPIAAVLSIVAFFLYSIVNGLFNSGSGGSDWYSILAVGFGSGAFVFVGTLLAPRYHFFAALALGGIVLASAIVFVYAITLPQSHTDPGAPLWQLWLLPPVALIGAVVAIANTKSTDRDETPSGPFFGRLPTIARWVFLVPTAVILAFLPVVTVGVVGQLVGSGINPIVLQMENFAIFPVLLITIGASIAPKHKIAVSWILAIPPLAIALAGIYFNAVMGPVPDEPNWVFYAFAFVILYSIIVALMAIRSAVFLTREAESGGIEA